MAKEQPYAVYKLTDDGDSFRELLMAYSKQRMRVDPKYRRAVNKMLAKRRSEREAEKKVAVSE